MASLTSTKPQTLTPAIIAAGAGTTMSGNGNVFLPSADSPMQPLGGAGARIAATAFASGVARNIPAHSPHSLSTRNVFTPYNTPSDVPPLAVPHKGPTTAGAGIVPGGAAGGRAIASAIRGRVPHAITPGNTPSSLEKIGRRMANNLMIANGAAGAGGGRIAPSYERRFSAGLSDLNRRLNAHADNAPVAQHAYASASPSLLGDKSGGKQADWPTSFTDETASMSSEREDTGNAPPQDQDRSKQAA